MSTRQIDMLLFPTKNMTDRSRVSSRCLHRLKILFHAGYVRRTEQAQTLSDGRKPLVYSLDGPGARYVADLTKKTVKELKWDHLGLEVGSLFLDHLLLTNDIRIAVMLAASGQEHSLLEWQDENTLRRVHQNEKITIYNDKKEQQEVVLIPDGYFVVKVTKNVEQPREYHQFLEIDRATSTIQGSDIGGRDWARKVQAYIAYHNSKGYIERYHTTSMRVLTITTTEARMVHLKEVTEKAGGRNRFWFTTFDKISADTIFFAPIWQIAQRDGYASYLE